MKSGTFLPRVLFGLLLAVASLLFPGAASASIRLTTYPQVIVADGRSTTTVTADVRDRQGRVVDDGTMVRFTTTAGQITATAFTSAGVARATLTSSTEPASAMVTAIWNVDQAVAKVQMVSKMVEANVDGRVLRLNARYVGFSEALRHLDAVQDARVKYRGLTIEANAIQIDLDNNHLRAFGRVGITSGEKVLEGERLYINLTTFEGYTLSADKKIWFSGYGLNELEQAPAVTPEFEFKELTKSTLSWVGKEAVYIPGVKVQVTGAKAYLGGIKALRIPYHEARLDGQGLADYGQYFGAGSSGIVVDFPVYVGMSPNATTAVRFRHGERTGLGYFSQRPGFSLDLEEKYGVPGKAIGTATLTDMASFNWGFRWNHTHNFGEKTRISTLIETPAHQDLFGSFNLSQQLGFGNASVSFGGSKLRERTLSHNFDASFETTPKPILDKKFFVSLGTRYSDIGGGQFEQVFQQRFEIQPSRTEEVNMRIRAETWQLLPKLTMANNVTLRQLWGTVTGPALSYMSSLNYTLPVNGQLGLNYTYDQVPPLMSVLRQARHNVTANASINPVKRFRASIFGTMGLDAISRSLVGQLSYSFTPSWRFDVLQSHYQFGDYGMTDYQFGVARKLGQREIFLYYSTERRRILFEFAGSQF